MTMMKQILFFALKEDVGAILDAVEAGGNLQYVPMVYALSPDLRPHLSGREIPHLGEADTSSTSSSSSFLVAPIDSVVKPRRIETNDGIRFAVDQLVNPDSVTFTPGGVWGRDIVLHGRVATASESGVSQQLMKQFQSVIRKRFTKVKAFWLGPLALERFRSDARLTMSADSPRDYDLVAE